MSYDLVLKYIILGDTGVGKSCLSQQFREKSFKQLHDPTIGADFGARIVTINGKKTKVQIWDTAGQEQFKSITQNYYRGAAGGILVYDITRRESFTRAASWLEDLRRHCTDNMTIMLIGNKSDLDDKRAVSTEDGSQFAQVHGLIFAECSAKTARNVEEAFTRTAIAIQESISNAQDLTALEHRGIRIVASNSGTRTEYESLSPRENRNRNRGSCCS